MKHVTPEHWQSISAHLDQALELEEPERARWLALLAHSDPAIAELLSEVLACREQKGFSQFLAGPSAIPLNDIQHATLIGKQVGPYVIEAEAGRGGMGSVWRARRADGRFESTVAIKFVHAAWIGQAGEQRFRMEGSMLAHLDHPNIARLLDAGLLDAAQPYLILEYVEGQQIDTYCNEHGLGVEARIRLFLEVLDAVAHAHRNLIVHRDIKPNNVLVTSNGAVKLLDFGIAKLLDSDSTAVPPIQSSLAPLTPQYAAPEQLLGKPITTATDVYPLGLMLYLLLTGHDATQEAARSRADLIRTVLTLDPPRASRVASLPSVSARSLAGDLDNILHKAMKKSPAERYLSAAEFAEDLRRHLATRPVLARPDTVAYRATKFVQRNRLGTVLAALVLLSLGGGTIVSTVQARRAIAESVRADQAGRRAQEQRDLALERIAREQDSMDLTSYLLGEALPEDRPEITAQVLLRGLNMVRAAKGIPPARRARMLALIGAHFEMLRDYAHAAQTFNEAHAQAMQGSDPDIQVATACRVALESVYGGAAASGAAPTIDAALAGLRADQQNADSRAECYLARSTVMAALGQSGIEDLEAAARALRELPAANWNLELAVSALLPYAYSNAMRVPEALHAYEREQQELERYGMLQWRDGEVFFRNRSTFLWKIGRPLDARASFEEAQRIRRERSNGDLDDAPALLTNARVAAQLGDDAAAISGYENTLRKASQAGDTLVENVALGEYISVLIRVGEFARAERELQRAERLVPARLPAGHWIFGVLRMQSALLAQHRGEQARAQQLADEAVALLAASATPSYQFPVVLVQRAQLEQRATRYAAALADAERALDIYDRRFGKEMRSAHIGDAWMAAQLAQAAMGDSSAAGRACALAVTHYASSLGASHAKTRAAQQCAG